MYRRTRPWYGKAKETGRFFLGEVTEHFKKGYLFVNSHIVMHTKHRDAIYDCPNSHVTVTCETLR